MQARDFLSQKRELERRIDNKRAEREQWMAIALSTTAAGSQETGVRVQSSGSKNQMENAVDRCIEIDQKIEALMLERAEKERAITEVIEQLKTDIYDVLHKTYIGVVDNSKPVDNSKSYAWPKYYTLGEIADLYDRSHSWAKAKRGMGHKNVQRILDAREKSTN